MKILITGATGFVGTKLCKKLETDGHQLVILSRNIHSAKERLKLKAGIFIEWSNYFEAPDLKSHTDLDGIIHLMGENIGDKRWSDEQKKILYSSRINSAHSLINAVNQNNLNLKFFITASAIGIYPTNTNEILTENSSLGNGFLAKLCSDWENAINQLPTNVRKVSIRTGVVFDHNGGALKKMLLPFKMGVGGIIGNGKQMMSWIHRDDIVNIYAASVTNADYTGAINACSPNPVSNYQFTKALGKALHRPTIFPVPEMALKIMFGEMSSIILDSQAVKSDKLTGLGFQFKYPKIEEALIHSV
jgi:uncharacterized protein (TIGR01777 family)